MESARTEARVEMVDRVVTEIKSLQMQRCSGERHLVMLLEMIADDERDYHPVFHAESRRLGINVYKVSVLPR